MKLGVFIFILLLSITSHAGRYYNPRIDTFDKQTGLYYKSIIKPGKRGLLSGENSYIKNINIYDPVTKKSKLLFEISGKNRISQFLYERSVQDNSVDFYAIPSIPIKNNEIEHNRHPKNKLLVGVLNEENNVTTFYMATKNGESLKQYFKVTVNEELHLDVKNSVIRVISQENSRLKIREIPW